MKGKITSPGTYADNVPRFEIAIYLDTTKQLPHKFGERVEYKLKIGEDIYTVGLNSSEQSGLWISPDVYLKGSPEKIRLSEILISNGFSKNEEVLLSYEAQREELEIHSLGYGTNSGTIRAKALKWYQHEFGKIDPAIYASKFYSPEESWTKDYVWFIQVPEKTIMDFDIAAINILCQEVIGSDNFYHLRVPTQFFRDNIQSFDRIKNSLAIYLSPRAEIFFIELRGKKSIDFKQFLTNW